jgi:hypothetical protein
MPTAPTAKQLIEAYAPAPPELAEQFTVHRDRARKYLELVQVAEINTRSLQLREATDPEAVARYADAYKAGEDLPPIVCFRDPTDDILHLADGHHRVAAAKRAQLCELHAIVRPGDRRAAVLYAAGSNEQHGLPRTNADKRKVVSTLLADGEWKTWSNRELARVSRTSEGFVRLVRKDVGAEVTEIKRKDGSKQQPRNAKAKQPRQTSLLDKYSAEALVVDETWQRMRELPGSEHLNEVKARILTALYHYNQARDPGAEPADCAMLRTVLEKHIGCPIDVHGGQLAASNLITRDAGGGFQLTSEIYHAIDDILRPIKPVDVPPTRCEIHTNLVAWPEIAARLRVAVAASGISANAYATKHNLPYLALVRTIAEGVEPSDEGVADTLYDHGAALPSPDVNERILEASERIMLGKGEGPEEITAGDPMLTIEQVADLLKAAMKSAGCNGITSKEMADHYGWNTAELDRVLAGHFISDAHYGPMYDVAVAHMRMTAEAAQRKAAPADPTPSPEVPPAPAPRSDDGAKVCDNTPLRPLGLRRLDKQREILALRLRGGKLAWQGSDDDLFLLARIAGVPSAPTAWIDAARATARVDFLSALARECADRVQTGETMNARKWPQLAELCRLWSLDHQAIEIEAERAVPA